MISRVSVFTVSVSFTFFTLLNKFLEYDVIPIPKRYRGEADQHKWRSAAVSLVHSVIIGVMALISLPYVWPDLVMNYPTIGELTIAISVGYFIYDLVNLLLHSKSNVFTLLIHHIIVIFFGLQFLYRRTELGYGIIGALVEINTIFMHIRQLLRMYDIPKQSVGFQMNNMLYIVSFIVNRVPSFLLVLFFLIGDRDRIPVVWHSTLFIGTACLLYLNVYLFWKLLTSDYLV